MKKSLFLARFAITQEKIFHYWPGTWGISFSHLARQVNYQDRLAYLDFDMTVLAIVCYCTSICLLICLYSIIFRKDSVTIHEVQL